MDIPTSENAVRRAVTNIGSSGLDGVQFDVFFEVEYRIDSFFDIDIDPSRVGTFDTEILSMDLSGSPILGDLDPGALIERVIQEASIVVGTVRHGHVTVLK